jgi:Phage late control gene D protein (GPD).
MYRMCHKITVGNSKLLLLESVNIVRSVDALADTATIVLPGMVHNEAINIEDKIHVGDAVSIELGYNDKLQNEFEGYVQRIGTDGGSITIECEDKLWLFRTAVKDKAYAGEDVKAILNDICQQCGGFSLNCDYSFKYDKFVVQNATGYDVLKKIQDEVKPNIYIKGNTLHVHPKYSEIFGEARYDFSRNVEAGGTQLEYRRKEDRKVLITVEGEKKNGTKVKVEVGSTGGDRVTLKLPGATDTESLRKLGEQALAERCYTGYSGSFDGWLWPYCDAGYKISLHDPYYEYKDGTYYVTAVEVNYSQSGGKRTITLGKRLS